MKPVGYNSIQALKRALNLMLNEALKSSAPSLWYKAITSEPPAQSAGGNQTASVDYPYGGAVHRLEEYTGNQLKIRPLSAGTFNVSHTKYGGGVSIPTEAYERDGIGLYADQIREYINSVPFLPQDLITAKLNAAHSTLCYDGQYLADTDHPVGSTSVANMDDSSDNAEVWALVDLQNGAKPCVYQKEIEPRIVIQNEPKDYEVFYNDQIVITAKVRGHVAFTAWDRMFFTDHILWNASVGFANFQATKQAFEAFKDEHGQLKHRKATGIIVGSYWAQTAHDIFDKDGMLVIGGTTNTMRGKLQVIEADADLAITF